MTFKKRRGGSKESKVTSNLTKTLVQYIHGKRYAPSTLSELIRLLDIADVHKPLFQKILDDLVEKGELTLQRQKYSLPTSAELVTGTISVHPKGFGFVKSGVGPDVFIPKQFLMDAVDGDTVEVEVNPVVSAKGPEGQVIAILKRSRTHLAGIIVQKTGRHYVAFSPLLGIDKPIKVKSKTPLNEGDRIICKVIEWHTEHNVVEGEMSHYIGHISDPSVDVKAAVQEFELPDGFSREAIEEAQSYPQKVSAKNRRDLTDWEIVTIDPDTAKDYDDAISLTCDERGHYFLGVHIADVSYYVKPNSHLDKEAYLRCNSTYFPGQCVPMLPEQLSNELCSLKPKVARLTQSVFAEFSPTGDLIDYQVDRTCIKSQKRFTYKEAFAVLQKEKSSPHEPLLRRMVDLCHLLKKKRFERGSIDFSMPDDVILVDDKGVPQKIERVEYDITHQMIEEFMLKANELVAKHLASQGKTLIYRVHEQPTAESFQDFYTFARSLGFHLPAAPTHLDIQKLFQDAKDSPLLPQLSVSFIRSMRLACYSSDNLGHYGLALEHYCHFTSPIRRYTDLIIQRLLFDELPDTTDIDAVATACSEKERISFRAESSVTVLKKLRLAGTYFAADPTRIYPAIVTRIKPFALFFEVPLFDLEGNIHISKLGKDYFEYNA
ncbi:MAG TPA: VacB/RNase II family 3'-5' exoribonuclease, partial [Chlamydiales bacterium]|nr:VacB/RNase II family 3'-5' exoribonuclease [Chlamydiales bacterium]